MPTRPDPMRPAYTAMLHGHWHGPNDYAAWQARNLTRNHRPARRPRLVRHPDTAALLARYMTIRDNA